MNMVSPEIIEFDEIVPKFIPEDDFDHEVARMLYYDKKKRIFIEFPSSVNSYNYVIRSNGYIGYIPLNEKYSLKIKPKVVITNIFRMLEYAYNLKRFEFLEGTLAIDSIEDIYERLANILSKRIIDRNRKGLFRDYVQHTERLPYFRGRVKIVPTVLSLLRGSLRIECDYQEHTAEVEDNQILTWVLFQLRRFNFQREEVKRNNRRAYRELINKVGLRQVEPRDCINRFYHRLNQDYKPMHGLCRFFLENCGPGLEMGEFDFIPFVIHMPTLFESFVAEWLRLNLPPEYKIRIQFRTQLDSEGRFSFQIDLVLLEASTGTVLGILDTKYKRNPDPAGDDIQQIVAYAVSMETKNAYLIYPSAITRNVDFIIGNNIRIRSLTFDLGQDPEIAGQEFIKTLLRDR